MDFGLTGYHVSWDKLEATDVNDLLLTGNKSTAVLPDFSLGIYYYTQKYFIGFSLPFFMSHVTDEKTGRTLLKDDPSDYNYFLTGGYEWKIGTLVKLLPSVLVKFHPESKMQTDLYVNLLLKNRIGLGLGYRNSDAIIGLLQCHINDQLKLSYSYDFDTGKSGMHTGGSHEVVLGYVFRYAREVPGPRQF